MNHPTSKSTGRLTAAGDLHDGAKINIMSLPTITTKQWAVTNKKKWGVRPIAWR